MKRNILSILVFFCIFFFKNSPAIFSAMSLDDINKEIIRLENQLSSTQNQAKNLSEQIKYFNNQINLTLLQMEESQSKINQLEVDIEKLSLKINRLEKSLDETAEILLNRIKATYISGQIKSLDLLFSSSGFSDFLFRFQYLKRAQAHDKKLMLEIQKTKVNYEEQKQLFEEKKKEKENLKIFLSNSQIKLDSQKKDKEYLLEVTKNDEVKYQQLLASARSELEAIQGIIAGEGEETEIGKINEGDKIASIIQGSSCNSSGTHIHFIVKQNGVVVNPLNFLKSGIDYENCSGSDCGSSDGDPFNPSGDWNWPLDPKIELFQGYGNTWGVNHLSWLPYKFHNGIDFEGSSSDVKAVKNGTLYRGSYNGACSLRYVRVKHEDSDTDTFYLHVNYF